MRGPEPGMRLLVRISFKTLLPEVWVERQR